MVYHTQIHKYRKRNYTTTFFLCNSLDFSDLKNVAKIHFLHFCRKIWKIGFFLARFAGSKRIILFHMKKVLVRLDGSGYYETLEDAAVDLGMTPGNVSRAVTENGMAKGVRMRWVDRVFAVRTRDAEWRICVMGARNDKYIPMRQVERAIPKKDVVEVKELTAAWHAI